jgi:hypothetical protein
MVVTPLLFQEKGLGDEAKKEGVSLPASYLGGFIKKKKRIKR